MGKLLERVLIIRLSSIGDVVLATPVIRNLKEKYPDCKIDFLVKSRYYDLLKSNPLLNKVFCLKDGGGIPALTAILKEIKQVRYSLILDLHRNLRSRIINIMSRKEKSIGYKKPKLKRWFLIHFKKNYYNDIHTITQLYLKALEEYGVDQKNICPELFPDETLTKKVTFLFEENDIHENERIIVFVPGAGMMTKEWPIEYYSALGKLLFKAYNPKIIVLGNEKDKEKAEILRDEFKENLLSLAGMTTLLEAAAIIKKANLVVTNDSGLMHISQAMDVPSVAIFGPTVKEFGFFPQRIHSPVIETELYCRPCSVFGSNRCKKEHFKCMKEISPDHVFQVCSKLLEKEN